MTSIEKQLKAPLEMKPAMKKAINQKIKETNFSNYSQVEFLGGWINGFAILEPDKDIKQELRSLQRSILVCLVNYSSAKD